MMENTRPMMIHMRPMIKRILTMLLSCSLLLCVTASVGRKVDHLFYSELLLSTLNPAIQSAVATYYGSPRLYGLYDAKILDVERLQPGRFAFKVTVQVNTFVGPHNPPYGVETMTIAVNTGSSKVIQYRHEDEESTVKSDPTTPVRSGGAGSYLNSSPSDQDVHVSVIIRLS
ncbi:DUF3888 domain-containing protein [Paenibacillus sp. NPDC057934]|uniref:DUF3888 domain-containing protein n=1 Tax=Paenibacillus sp. NPDC057934 TaxID=3346282 RepID=UPI0036DE9250